MTTCFAFVLFIFYDSYEAKRIYGDLFGLATAILIGGSAVVIRYGKLVNLTMGLFNSPYAATSLSEYFANGFEAFFIGDKDSLRAISPTLHEKITIKQAEYVIDTIYSFYN